MEKKVSQFRKRGTIYLTAGTAAIVAGAATIIKLNSDYRDYKREIQNTNDTYTAWYQANYKTAPPAGDLQKLENFGKFASPGIYFGAVAVVGGVALELMGLKNIQLAKKVRAELDRKKRELSFQPYYEAPHRAGGLRIALSF
ncbi:hypothetical protein [Dyadobacter sp. 676]|uniref:YtxH domain-containing protein n=1 Tax=Dyadobacter sp. 676 TaxID=3088362 RepID=A0AAU8FJN2_9BACT